jgi:hypothetical protein
MSTDNPKLPIDQDAVDLLKSAVTVLSETLNALPTTSGARLNWLIYSAIHINRLAHAYITLREARQLYASKVYVRPLLEAAFHVGAVINDESFIFRIACYEREQDRKFLEKRFSTAWAETVKEFGKFEEMLRKTYPSLILSSNPSSAFDAAEKAKILDAYQIDYRLYSKFIHGSLRAMSGSLDLMTDPRDTPNCLFAVLVVLDYLKAEKIGNIPDLTPYLRWLYALVPK